MDAVSYVGKVNELSKKLGLGVYELVDGKDYPYRVVIQKKSVISERQVPLPLLDLSKDSIKGEWDDAFLKQLKTYLKQNAADAYVQGIIKKE
jgi:hypothetical protein